MFVTFLVLSILSGLSHNEGQKYCRMLQREHSAILSTFIRLPLLSKIFVLSIFFFQWLLKTGFTVFSNGRFLGFGLMVKV